MRALIRNRFLGNGRGRGFKAGDCCSGLRLLSIALVGQKSWRGELLMMNSFEWLWTLFLVMAALILVYAFIAATLV